MKPELVMKTTRSAVLKLEGAGKYYAECKYELIVNGERAVETDRTVTTIRDLEPDTEYTVCASWRGERTKSVRFRTDREYVTLNVRNFGAYGDGIHDDTGAVQAAVTACPLQSRVLFPEGVYKVSCIFLKSDITLHLEKGAVISAFTERDRVPVLPGTIESSDGKEEYNIGSCGGNPADVFASVITGIGVRNVVITGEGTIDGCAGFDNWWKNPVEIDIAARPKLLFLSHCENVTLHGITVTNSPQWTVHPYRCRQVKCIDLTIINPKNSPNTDGFNPESCEDVLVLGTMISVGDDCIAVKSGKIEMALKSPMPAENLVIKNCCMRDGHGAVTLGSENAGGVFNVLVKDCEFYHTDRGLRIKTRRGRGEKSVIDGIVFDNIAMDGVMTPIVVNSFYFCDPDGRSPYVASKEKLPVDERTPFIKKMAFRNIRAVNCHVAAAYIYGLPERKIERLVLENVEISFAENARSGMAAMMVGCDETVKSGITAVNVEEVVLQNVTLHGVEGEERMLRNVDTVKEECGKDGTEEDSTDAQE